MNSKVGISCVLFALSAMASACSNSGEAPAAQAGEARPAEKSAKAAEPAASPAAPQPDMMATMRDQCPMGMEGVSVSVADADGGVSLTFEAEEGDLADLRRRAQHMAEMYGAHGGHAGMMWHHVGGQGMGADGMHGGGMMHGAGKGPDGGMMHGAEPMPAANAKVEETEKGARITLTPQDVAQLDALREHARMHQQRMGSGECWMLTEAKPQPDGGGG